MPAYLGTSMPATPTPTGASTTVRALARVGCQRGARRRGRWWIRRTAGPTSWRLESAVSSTSRSIVVVVVIVVIDIVVSEGQLRLSDQMIVGRNSCFVVGPVRNEASRSVTC